MAETEVPAVSSPVPYELKFAADGGTMRWKGAFRPEKRWRIFAGLKIHNNGYILRRRETAGQKGTARLLSPVFALAAASLATGVEDTTTPLAVKPNSLEIPLAPHKFTTVRLVFGIEAGNAGTATAGAPRLHGLHRRTAIP